MGSQTHRVVTGWLIKPFYWLKPTSGTVFSGEYPTTVGAVSECLSGTVDQPSALPACPPPAHGVMWKQKRRRVCPCQVTRTKTFLSCLFQKELEASWFHKKRIQTEAWTYRSFLLPFPQENYCEWTSFPWHPEFAKLWNVALFIMQEDTKECMLTLYLLIGRSTSSVYILYWSAGKLSIYKTMFWLSLAFT